MVAQYYYTVCVHFSFYKVYTLEIYIKKDAVIGQKDGYVLRLTRAFTRQ